MFTIVKASEISPDVPEFKFGSDELAEFHKEAGRNHGRGCDWNHHGVQYIVNHGKFRTLNTLDTFHVTPYSVDIEED